LSFLAGKLVYTYCDVTGKFTHSFRAPEVPHVCTDAFDNDEMKFGNVDLSAAARPGFVRTRRQCIGVFLAR